MIINALSFNFCFSALKKIKDERSSSKTFDCEKTSLFLCWNFKYWQN